jgi:tetratricopeptide (TPR) repeat protein
MVKKKIICLVLVTFLLGKRIYQARFEIFIAAGFSPQLLVYLVLSDFKFFMSTRFIQAIATGFVFVLFPLALVFAGLPRSSGENLNREMAFSFPQDTAAIYQLLRQGEVLALTQPKKALTYYKRALAQVTPENGTGSRVFGKLGWYYLQQSQYDSASLFFRRMIMLHQTPAERVEAYRGLALIHLRESSFDSSHYYLSEALSISLKEKDYKLQAHVHNDQGNVAIEENDYVTALNEYLQTALLYDSVLHDVKGSCTALLNIGNVHYVLGNLDKAIAYARKGKAMSEQYAFSKGIIFGLKLLGRIYRKQQKLDSALYYNQRAMRQYLQEGDKQNAAETMLSIANIYYDLEEYHQALKVMDEATLFVKAIEGPSVLPYIYSTKGFAYHALRQWDQAKMYFDSSRLLAAATHHPYLVMDAYEMLSKVEKDRGHPVEALNYFEKFYTLKDSLTQAENRRQVEEINARYESEKKESEIALLQKDKRIATIWTYTLMVILVLALLMIWLFINRSRLKIRTTQILAEKEKLLHARQKELLESELRTKRLEEERLKQELDFKNKELTTYTLNLIQKNEVMEELRTALENLSKENSKPVASLIQKLNYSAHLDKEWDGFKRYFEQVHAGFFERLLERYPDLSATDMKLCALLKLNLETKEIASLMGISPESAKVSRSRLRKKLNLDGDQNLSRFLATFK